MALTHRYTFTVSIGSQVTSRTVSLTNDSEHNLDVEVEGGSVNKRINLAFDADALTSIYIVSDVDIELTFVDGTTSPLGLDLEAGKPFTWYEGCGSTNPFTDDVQYVTADNANTDDAALVIRCLTDDTP